MPNKLKKGDTNKQRNKKLSKFIFSIINPLLLGTIIWSLRKLLSVEIKGTKAIILKKDEA